MSDAIIKIKLEIDSDQAEQRLKSLSAALNGANDTEVREVVVTISLERLGEIIRDVSRETIQQALKPGGLIYMRIRSR
ncbi:TPA: hypothetical protein JHK28_000143 [Enterobacter cloacae]|nr:hypothetical protein [Enterobacter cloacae]